MHAIDDSFRNGQIDSIQFTHQEDSLRNIMLINSELWYRRKVTDNLLNNLTLHGQSLPILGIEVPYIDFPIVISIMLSIFSIMMLLNQRICLGAVNDLHLRYEFDQVLPVLVQANFTFTGLSRFAEKPRKRDSIWKLIEYATYCTPAFAGLLELSDVVYIHWFAASTTRFYYYNLLINVLAVISIISLSVACSATCAYKMIKLSKTTDDLIEHWKNVFAIPSIGGGS